MRDLIRHILQESNVKNELLDVIRNEDIFAAADLVGGIHNLRKIFKDNSDVVEKLDSFNGRLDLIYHSRKEFIEIPMKFEIVGKGENVFKNNSWPKVNLIYDDSKLSESEKKLFEQFIYHTIGDLNIDNVVIAPSARQMFREKNGYIAIDYVNGRDLETLDHDIRYEDDDIKNIHREYYTKSYMNESKDESQNKKVKLVTQMIYDLFDEVTNIEQSTYLDKPLLTIYFKTDSKAANNTSWFAEYITDGLHQIIGDNIVVLPYWTFYWDPRLENVDIYISTKQHDEDGNVIDESKILQENEEDPTQKVLNALLRRSEVEEKNLGDDENPIKFKVLKIHIGDGTWYSITMFENKKEQVRRVINILMDNGIINRFELNETRNNPYAQKVIRAVRQFITQVM